MTRLILLQINPPVATITLNRPERHNSLVPAMLADLLAALQTVRERPEIRAILLQAAGRSFSTGGDIRGFTDNLDEIETYAEHIVGLLNRTILEMLSHPLPIVSAVQGAVTGGSLGLVLASDIVLAAKEAFFAPYYAVVGFSPDGGWTAMLPELIGHGRVRDVLLANRAITTEKALEWGMVDRIENSAELQTAALEQAHAIAGLQPASLSASKRLLLDQLGDVEGRLECELKLFVETIAAGETRDSMLVFLDSLSQSRGDAGEKAK
jgi:2-(1,2-epoxy-1,2-dihydrophenyl)acetyl-CoA isomerase